MENGKKPAFPLSSEAVKMTGETGALSKRELFAAMAMQGMLANNSMIDNIDDGSLNIISQAAARSSDALLLELEKSK